jgi:putative transposase
MISRRRVYYNGAVYYVTAQGKKEVNILGSEEAKRLFFDSLMKFKERFGFALYAYTILDNSVNIVLQTDFRNNISKIMQAILLSFSKKFQYRYHFKGHVWQGRFESILLNKDQEVARYIRFIHLKPVMMEKVHKANDYEWEQR